MNRSDIIDKLSELYPKISHNNIDKAVKRIFNLVSDSIIEGNRVEIRGFACFSLKQRNAGFVRNPRDGVSIPRQARSVVYFRAGKELKDRVNLKS